MASALIETGNDIVNPSASFIMEPGEICEVSGQSGLNTGIQDGGISMTVEKDFSNTNMAHIIKPAVAYIKDVKAPNAAAGNAGTAGWWTRELNNLSGETWFITTSGTMGHSGTNTNFTLEAGTYEVSGFVTQYHGLNSTVKLTNVTDSTTQIKGQSAYYNAANEVAGQTPFMGSFTITSSKEFKVEQYVSGAAYLGVGLSSTTGDEVYTQVTIRKLK
jgi:hypothetical protein